jgi:hypothetical protein
MSRRRNELVPDQPRVVVLESYVSSSEGPTIRVDVQTGARLDELETIMRNLASGGSSRVLLSQLGDTHWVYPLKDVVLAVGPKWATPRISYVKHGEQLLCEWTDSPEGWLDSADKTAAMTASGNPCHQYFSGRHAALRQADSVSIEIAFLE